MSQKFQILLEKFYNAAHRIGRPVLVLLLKLGNAQKRVFAHGSFFLRVDPQHPMGVKPWGSQISVFGVLLIILMCGK